MENGHFSLSLPLSRALRPDASTPPPYSSNLEAPCPRWSQPCLPHSPAHLSIRSKATSSSIRMKKETNGITAVFIGASREGGTSSAKEEAR